MYTTESSRSVAASVVNRGPAQRRPLRKSTRSPLPPPPSASCAAESRMVTYSPLSVIHSPLGGSSSSDRSPYENEAP